MSEPSWPAKGRLKAGCSQDWLPHKAAPIFIIRCDAARVMSNLCHLHQKPGDGDCYAGQSGDAAQHRKHALPRNEVERAEHQSDLQQPLAHVIAQSAVPVGSPTSESSARVARSAERMA